MLRIVCILLNVCSCFAQVFASSQVNGNSVGNIEIETVTGTDSIDSSDGVEDDCTDTQTDASVVDSVTELPSLD